MSQDGGSVAEAEYRKLIRRAASDSTVSGVVVFGSRAAGPYAEPASDVDVFVVVDGAADLARSWQTEHGAPVEIWAMTLDEFRNHGLPGDRSAWNRPAFLRARVDLDKLDGEIGRIVERKRRLDDEEAATLVDAALDDAINSIYRALRNLEGGRALGGRLDALESIGPLLTTVFALEGRVRPFNKWLEYELEQEPFTTPAFRDLVPQLDALTRDPAPHRIRAAFRMLDGAARAAGHGAVVDGWEPDVQWLRGEALFRH